jgi:hypothetical protein
MQKKTHFAAMLAGLGVLAAGQVFAQGFIIDSVLYQTDFTTDQSANFTVSHQAAPADNQIDFNYDYSTFAQAAGGFPTSIPQSPSTVAANSRALRMATNTGTTGAVNAITATLNGVSGSNLRITFDGWINYNGGAGGGTGSTEFITFGASANSALPAAFAGNYLTGVNPAFSGIIFALTGEGGAAQDYRYYDGNGGPAVGNNGALANFGGVGAIDHNEAFFQSTFPSPAFETAGAPGKAWLTYELVILNGSVRLSITKPDSSQVILCNWFMPNPGTTLTGLAPHFGTADTFSSLAVPASDNFVLIDNVKVEAISAAASADNWALYQ